jgi:hypothetical protein
MSARIDRSSWLSRRRSRQARSIDPTDPEPAVAAGAVTFTPATLPTRLRCAHYLSRHRRAAGPPVRIGAEAIHRVRPNRRGDTVNDIVARYLAVWNETDPAARRALIDDLYTADAGYIDPLVEAHGHDAIDGCVDAAQAQFPGLVFSLVGPVDSHHRQARFSWGLGPRDGEPLVIGFDVVVTDEHDRLTRVHGFLDKVPG